MLGCKWIACGMIAGTIVGAVGAMALTGELNQKGMNKVAQSLGMTTNNA